MPRKKGVETWRRIRFNAEKIPDIFIDGRGAVYIKARDGKVQPLEVVTLAAVLADVKTDLMKLSAELEMKGKNRTPKKKGGGHAAGQQPTT